MSTRFYRIRENRMLGGVCTGLAEYFDVDVVIVRIIFITFAFLWGFSIIIYLLLWILVPQLPNPIQEVRIDSRENQVDATATTSNLKNRSREIFGIIIIILGIFMTLNNLLPWFSHRLYLPLTLIMLGLLILFYSQNSVKNESK